MDTTMTILQYGIAHCADKWHPVEPGSFFHRIYVALGGEAYYHDASRTATLKSGSLYILPANRPYELTHDPQKPFQCLFFHIAFFPLLLTDFFEAALTEEQGIQELTAFLKICLQEQQDFSLHSKAIDLFITYLRQRYSLSVLQDEKIHNTLLFIHENYAKELSNQQLSQVAGYEKCYFNRYFKQKTGFTPQKYLLHYRIQAAKQRLSSKEVSVSETAYACGFPDAKAFSRTFKVMTGLSPSQYKRCHFVQP